MALPSLNDYAQAMAQHGDVQVDLTLPIEGLMMILTSLQLAMRLPEFPEQTRPFLEDFLAGCRAKMDSLSPALTVILQMNTRAPGRPTP